MFKNKYEVDNSRFGEVLTQVLSAHGIGVRQFLAEAKVGKTRFYAVKRGRGLQSEHLRAHGECHA